MKNSIFKPLAIAALAALSPAAFAQPEAAKPITIIVPTPAGGGHDALARLLASKLGPALGRTVIVDNKAGAGGTIGAQYVASAAPDGSTFMMGSPNETVIAPFVYKNIKYSPAKDLQPVSLVGMTPLVFVASPSLGVKNMGELIAKAKSTPGSLNYASSGTGTSTHLATELLNSMAKLNLQHIPYKGAAPSVNDVLGGQVPFTLVGMAPVMSQISAGKLVALAIAQPKRAEFAPNIPTVAETPGLEGFAATHWMGFFAPAKTDKKLVDTVSAEIHKIVTQPEFKARMLSMGIDPVGSTSTEFEKFLEQDRLRYGKMVQITGLQPE